MPSATSTPWAVRRKTALNLVGYPDDKLSLDWLGDILRGGADRCREAGAVILGGHTVRDAEIKFGMAVTGLVHPQKIWTNATARPGDKLVLTKRSAPASLPPPTRPMIVRRKSSRPPVSV